MTNGAFVCNHLFILALVEKAFSRSTNLPSSEVLCESVEGRPLFRRQVIERHSDVRQILFIGRKILKAPDGFVLEPLLLYTPRSAHATISKAIGGVLGTRVRDAPCTAQAEPAGNGYHEE